MAAASSLKNITNTESAKMTIKTLDSKISSRRLSKFWEVLDNKESGISSEYVAGLSKQMPAQLSDQQAKNILNSIHAVYLKETGVRIPLASSKTVEESKATPTFF